MHFVLVYVCCMLSITGGYHRLWSHRTYESDPSLKLFFLLFGTMASQNSVIWWARAHRAHHTHEDKPGDPYNISKGLLHAHIGWLLFGCDEVERRAISNIDVRDLIDDPMLRLQHIYYNLWYLSCAALFTALPVMLWEESLYNSFGMLMVTCVCVLQSTYCVNSFAHFSGDTPYNGDINARENLAVSLITMGEGWHNYHHSYPKDYKASRRGKYNPTTWFIDVTKRIGVSRNHLEAKSTRVDHKERFDLKHYEPIFQVGSTGLKDQTQLLTKL